MTWERWSLLEAWSTENLLHIIIRMHAIYCTYISITLATTVLLSKEVNDSAWDGLAYYACWKFIGQLSTIYKRIDNENIYLSSMYTIMPCLYIQDKVNYNAAALSKVYKTYHIDANFCEVYILRLKNLAVIHNFILTNRPVPTIY
jgi:hypothetical protein